jgi:hypothetical protein
MMRRSSTALVLTGVGAGALAAASYAWVIRPWTLRWGASREEVEMALPGDDLLRFPKISATHAVTIQARPAEVWPWLAQLGQGRGGFYSYEWLENMMGLDIHNADRIMPEFQDIKAGDVVPLAPDNFGLPVHLVEPEETLVLYGDTRRETGEIQIPMKPGDYLACTWGFFLFELVDGATRLVERWRVDWAPSVQNTIAYRAFLEPGAFLMERKMLLGIKARAEQLAGSQQN